MIKKLLQEKQFGRIHHGYLNDLSKLRGLETHCGKHQGYLEIAEGDLCWFEDGEDTFLFFKHPAIFNILQEKSELKKEIKAGRIVTLENVLDSEFLDLNFIIELKNGYGDSQKALEKTIRLLEDKAKGRYWIDGFYPKHLKLVRSICSSSCISLHTRLGVYGKYTVRSSFEFPFSGLLNLYKMPWLDIVTVTYKYSPAKYFKRFGATIDTVHKHVNRAGKALVFGGVDDADVFKMVEKSGANAAYLKFDKGFFSTKYEGDPQPILTSSKPS